MFWKLYIAHIYYNGKLMLILKPELLKALMFEEDFQHNKSASNFDFILGKTWSNSISKQK